MSGTSETSYVSVMSHYISDNIETLMFSYLQEDMLKAWGWVLGYSVIFAALSSASVAVRCLIYSFCNFMASFST